MKFMLTGHSWWAKWLCYKNATDILSLSALTLFASLCDTYPSPPTILTLGTGDIMMMCMYA